MWGKIMIPMSRLRLHVLYGPWGPLSEKRLTNLIIYSPPSVSISENMLIYVIVHPYSMGIVLSEEWNDSRIWFQLPFPWWLSCEICSVEWSVLLISWLVIQWFLAHWGEMALINFVLNTCLPHGHCIDIFALNSFFFPWFLNGVLNYLVSCCCC